MFRLLTISLSLVVLPLCLEAQAGFDQYYTTGAVRYDFELVGDHSGEEVIHMQTKYLPNWGGNPNLLVDSSNLGTYRYQVFESRSGNLIFQKGFSPLFMEWQTTAEAKQRKRAYYQALFFPRPKSDVTIRIQNRDVNNAWQTIYTDSVLTDNYFIVDETFDRYDVDTLTFSGDPAHKIDLVVLAEGYKTEEFDKFVKDTRRLTDHLLSVNPFCDYKDRFNIYAVKVPSVDSGTSVPGEHIYKNTAFNSHYYTFDTPRYLTSDDMKSIYNAIDGLGWDHIYLLVNTERYGGGGMYNFLTVCTTDDERSPFVFCHEFGHGFAGLGDEYYSSSTSYEEFYGKDTEPWEPNLTSLVDFDSKWKAMVDHDVPVPTPRDSIYFNRVGVFEGGGYVAKGIYSPVMSCWMKEHTANGFCPVCQKAIERAILLQTQ